MRQVFKANFVINVDELRTGFDPYKTLYDAIDYKEIVQYNPSLLHDIYQFGQFTGYKAEYDHFSDMFFTARIDRIMKNIMLVETDPVNFVKVLSEKTLQVSVSFYVDSLLFNEL